MTPPSNKISNFWYELKRRKVVRVITVYAAAAFIILEAVDIIFPRMEFPDWTVTFVIFLLVIGFVIAIILSWVYDVTPKGIEKTEPAHKVKEEDKPVSSKGWKIASYISFVVIVALIVLHIIPPGSQSDRKEILDKSIAVLPFKYLSDEPDKQYLADGTMDAILLHLSRIKDLRVLARTSVEQYRETEKTATMICQELDVSYLLEGSFQKHGDQARLIVQLIEPGKEDHAWANEYNREWKDIFTVQSEVAQLVAKELQAVITPEEKHLIEKKPTTNLTAWDYFQRGREEHWNYNGQDMIHLDKAKDLYLEALKYDSTFAQAYTGLAWVYWHQHYWNTFLSEDFLDSVLILSDIALSYDDQLSEAYTFRGWYYYQIGQFYKAFEELDKAIQLNPNDWFAYMGKGYSYTRVDLVTTIENYHKAALLNRGQQLPMLFGQLAWSYGLAGFREKAEYYIQEKFKLERDSFSFYFSLFNLESTYGNYAMAIDMLNKCFTLDSGNFNTIWNIVYISTLLEEYEEAVELYKKYLDNTEAKGLLRLFGLHRIGLAYWENGYKEEGKFFFNEQIKALNEMKELGRGIADSIRTAYDLAAVHAFLGEKDKAFEYLEIYRHVRMRSLYGLTLIKNDPLFNSIRDEPEFQQIMQEVEAQYQAEHERVRKWLEENDIL